jgi:hypothetical protein
MPLASLFTQTVSVTQGRFFVVFVRRGLPYAAQKRQKSGKPDFFFDYCLTLEVFD